MALGHDVQANIGRVARFADGSRRNWGLYFFFRILPQQELEADVDRLTGLVAALLGNDREAADKAAAAMQVALEHPAAMNVRMTPADRKKNGQKAAEAPAQVFLDWLKLLVKPDTTLFGDRLKKLMEDAGISMAAPAIANAMSPPGMFHRFLDDFVLPHLPNHGRALENILSLGKIAAAVPAALFDRDKFKTLFGDFGGDAGQSGLTALEGGLPKVVLYELLRQIAPSHLKSDDGTAHGVMRSEAAQDETLPGDDDTSGHGWDRAPINIAFTYPGLAALQVDDTTLASFPTVFRQGMAARADVLGDTGPSAPENWEGVLGLDCVHGYFTGGFLVGGQDLSVPAAYWQRLRDDVQAYNNRAGERGRFLRVVLRALFMLAGMEILHIELGEDPHEVGDDGSVQKLDYRVEHFGFRDGISQPFVDMKLGDPPPGGGTPAKNRSWSPVAAGEIYLDQPDEDGAVHKLPIHPLLRQGSTFLVFRKLEQDVAAFRMYLSRQRPGNRAAQEKLASQFIGRWKNGTSLVMAPDEPMDLGRDPDGRLNNFLYAADDPDGLRCPLGSHARRVNPRDIGDRDGVRRHRILRRAISYGGPLLPEGVLGDGNRRGLLFVAANARIDVQFELIQTRWINQGEFLGQAGLNRCPITGANAGGPTDAFLEAGSGVPVTGVPRFVITRGGDYFFAPGLSALDAIADGNKFKVEKAELPYRGFSMGDAATPILFDVDRLTGYADRILADDGPSVIRINMPGPAAANDPISPPVAFIARLADVQHVLSMKVNPQQGNIINSVVHYHTAVQRLSRGQDMLVSTERGTGGANNADRRERLDKILNETWLALGPDVYPRLQAIIKTNMETALRRVGPTRNIDLVYDLASVTVYDIVCKLFGTPGPNWLTELAISLPFSQQHVSGLPPEWLTAVHFDKPDNVGLTTLQIWSILMFAQAVGNVIDQDELLGPSNQAGSEYLTYIDSLIATARTRPISKTANLLSAFVALEDPFVKMFNYSADDYYADVRMLLMELMGSMMTNIPATFGLIMQTLLDHNLPLSDLIPILLAKPQFPLAHPGPAAEDGVARLIYEATRINGPLKVLMRSVVEGQVLPSGGQLNKGEWVVAILAAASIDPRPDAFPDPYRFSLRPFMPGPERKLDNYLLFGATGGGRDCWGRNRLALVVLKECLKTAGRLQLLQRVAGAAGEPREVAMITIGLPARFTGVLPEWK